MSDVVVDLPGTAGALPDDPSSVDLNAVKWRVHDSITAIVETDARWADDVARQLGADTPLIPEVDGPPVRLVIEVTHTAAFLSRLFSLEPRVRLIGGDEIRAAARTDCWLCDEHLQTRDPADHPTSQTAWKPAALAGLQRGRGSVRRDPPADPVL